MANLSNDAVNEANQYTDIQFGRLNSRVNKAQKEARSAAAIGLAASSLRFDDRPGKFSIGIGGGAWRGQGAIAFGAGYTDNSGRIRGNLSGTIADNKLGVGGGVTFTLN